MAPKYPSFQHKIAGQSGFKTVDKEVRILALCCNHSLILPCPCSILPVINVAIDSNLPEVRHRLVFVAFFILCHETLIIRPQLTKRGKMKRKHDRNESLSDFREENLVQPSFLDAV